ISVLEGARAQALWRSEDRCRGLICDDGRVIGARAVVIATGGAGGPGARTPNPPGSQGLGMLLAHAAGAALADLELLQFHPTAVIGVRGREGFLVTGAIRARLQETGARSVGLDMRAIDPAHFPNVVAALRDAGLDPARELIPVAPAAHYMMGGIVTDLDARATIAGLYAVGESSCTGLHGANRLASNSLSECFVFARRAVRAALAEDVQPAPSPSAGELSDLAATAPPPVADAATCETVWRDAGVVRSREGLERLSGNAHPLAALIAHCALARTESRGAHLRAEFPD